MLEQQVKDSLKLAMKAKESDKMTALRSILTAFTTLNTSGKEVTEDIRLKELQRLVKQRQESATIFKDNNRPELFEKEIFEISVIEEFLPKQLTEDEVRAEVELAIQETGATSMKEMGKVIGLVTKKLIGKADGKTISNITKSLLS